MAGGVSTGLGACGGVSLLRVGGSALLVAASWVLFCARVTAASACLVLHRALALRSPSARVRPIPAKPQPGVTWRLLHAW